MNDDRARLLAQRESMLAKMRNAAKAAGQPTRRVHLTVAMDRFLFRMLQTTPWGTWILKGGYANQLRDPGEARFTEDIDLKIDARLDQAQGILAAAAQYDAQDLFSYELGGAPTAIEGAPGGGLSFRINANLVGSFLLSFGADINTQDAVVGQLERHNSDPVLGRLGYPISLFPTYPLAQQFAEKLHAYTLPRLSRNTRAKDLADMVWYTECYGFESGALIDACVATFSRRATHAWPPVIPDPPVEWAAPYAAFRSELKLAPATPKEALDVVVRFLEPVLRGIRGVQYRPSAPRRR